jgi:hypothetical protein
LSWKVDGVDISTLPVVGTHDISNYKHRENGKKLAITSKVVTKLKTYGFYNNWVVG